MNNRLLSALRQGFVKFFSNKNKHPLGGAAFIIQLLLEAALIFAPLTGLAPVGLRVAQAFFLFGSRSSVSDSPPADSGSPFLEPLRLVAQSVANQNAASPSATAELPFISTLAGGEIISYTNPTLDNRILLPKKATVLTYAVKAGDTPSEIAAEFGIDTQTVFWANNLSERSLIRPGDELIILPVDGVRHRVSAGDTVSSIARKYQTTVAKIIEFNDIGEDAFIREGQYLIIPDGIRPRPAYRGRRVTGGTGYVQAQLPAGYFIYPTSGRNWGRLHPTNAVDIANACGTPIYAAAAGRVTRSKNSGWHGGFGKYIMIKHPNGVVTAYAHLQQALVGVGAQVGQGDLIAYMGTTGRSTGCHVHFEVRGAKNPFVRY